MASEDVLEITISYDDRPEDAVELLERVVSFLGGELVEITPDAESPMLSYEIYRNREYKE